MKYIGWGLLGLLALVLILVLGFGIELFGIEKDRILKPKRAEVEREVFENTPSYIHGMKQDLVRYYAQWNRGDAETKKGIEATVRLRFAQFDPKHIEDAELYNFLKRCLRGG